MNITKTRAKLTRTEIKRRRKHLTADGYDLIIMAVHRVHGITLSKRTVDAYLRCEKVPKTGKRRKDIYGILPLYVVLTDAEKDLRTAKMKRLAQTLEP
jgi:hypothetical protein